MANLAWIVEESVWEDFDCGRTERQVRFIRMRGGDNRGEKRYEIFLKSGDLLASRVIPEGASCGEFLKEALEETAVLGYGPIPTDLSIGSLDGRMRTRMEYEHEEALL